jgi:hypothetical protein
MTRPTLDVAKEQSNAHRARCKREVGNTLLSIKRAAARKTANRANGGDGRLKPTTPRLKPTPRTGGRP